MSESYRTEPRKTLVLIIKYYGRYEINVTRSQKYQKLLYNLRRQRPSKLGLSQVCAMVIVSEIELINVLS